MHASGISGPRGDRSENGRSSGTSGPVASRDDGAIFLTAAKTNKGSDAWYDLIPTPDWYACLCDFQ